MSSGGGIWPNSEQELLLQSALAPPAVAVQAWRRWSVEVDLESIDHPSFRMLGLLSRRMEPLGLVHPAAARIKGAYRQTWVRSNMLVKTVERPLQVLSDAGIETLLMKGVPLAINHYRDLGARWMSDADVLVPLERLAETHELLEREGWTAVNGNPLPLVRRWHGSPYADALGHQIDLHWRSLWQPAPDDDFRERAIPLAIGAAPSTTLCREDHLLHTCVHGAIREFAPRISWVADATVLIGDGEGLDWERVIERARARQATVATAAVLDYVSTRLGAPVPADVLGGLRASRAPLAERAAFRGADRPLGTRTASVLWDRYRRFDALDVPGPRPSGFVSYAADMLGFSRRRELLTAGPRRATRFVRARLPRAIGGLGDRTAARGPDAA
jgi:Uncharacterised nucleotidyltransferase